MWPDNETTLDLLGFKVHADLLRSVVLDSTLLPVTIGVFGDWGGGKTSVMKMLQQSLAPDTYEKGSSEREQVEKIACLYFNGWLFEGYDDAKAALLSSVLLQLGAHKRFGPKTRDSISSLLESVNWMRLARLGFSEVALPAVLAYLTGGVSLVPSIVNSARDVLGGGDVVDEQDKASGKVEGKLSWEDIVKNESKVSGPMDVRTFRQRFSQMINDSNIESLVILIDDLDRCSPQRIIDNLEAIKLFLSVDRTAFVIGADPRIVRHAIATVYKPSEIETVTSGYESQTDVVTDYLEKVIQVPYHLPRLSPSEVETYIALLFCQKYLPNDKFKHIHQTLQEHRIVDRYTVFGSGAINASLDGNLPTELTQSLSFCAATAPLITEGLKGNPRQVKRFLNAFVLRKQLAQIANLVNIKDAILVKLMVLEYAHPNQFNQLFRWQAAQDGLPNELKRLEETLCPPEGSVDNETGAKEIDPDWATTTMRRWVVMEPSLSDVDLRDYFWIARDRLQSTLSDVSLVPPVVRRITEDMLSGNFGRQTKGIGVVKELDSDEISMLIELLTRHVVRHPAQKEGFDALRLLTEEDVPGSAEALASVLSNSLASTIPPAVGVDIQTLLKAKPKLNDIFEPVLSRLRRTDTKIAAAIKRQKG